MFLDANSCSNHGHCNAEKQCKCDPGYKGEMCEVEKSCEEDGDVCLNGGTCTNSNSATLHNVTCNCPIGFRLAVLFNSVLIFYLAGNSVSDKIPVILILTPVVRACVALIVMTIMSVTVEMIQLAKHVRNLPHVMMSPVLTAVNVSSKVHYLSVIVSLVSMVIFARIRIFAIRITVLAEMELVNYQRLDYMRLNTF